MGNEIAEQGPHFRFLFDRERSLLGATSLSLIEEGAQGYGTIQVRTASSDTMTAEFEHAAGLNQTACK